MGEVIYKQNSKAMYVKLIKAAPEKIRKEVSLRLQGTLRKFAGKGGAITEEMIFKYIKEQVPPDGQAIALKAVESLKTK